MRRTVPCPKHNTIFPIENLDNTPILQEKKWKKQMSKRTKNKNFILRDLNSNTSRISFSQKCVLLSLGFLFLRKTSCFSQTSSMDHAGVLKGEEEERLNNI